MAQDLDITCDDGFVLRGKLWLPEAEPDAVVIITCATGVKASYYHRYAAFLAENGMAAVTFDYRGIGASRPPRLRGLDVRWRDWGLRDIDAVLAWAAAAHPSLPLRVVGHSFGGIGVPLAGHGKLVSRMLTVGAQHAFLMDYRRGHRLDYWWRWHVFMPLAAVACGFFPGRRLGWLEDLPSGVALDWARSRRDFTAVRDRSARDAMRRHLGAFTADVLAVAATDDPYATRAAVVRALGYLHAERTESAYLEPTAFGQAEIGHFALFHSRFRATFWADSVRWLRDGENPWRAASASSAGMAGTDGE